MPKFKVEVTRTFLWEVAVEARTQEEAEDLVDELERSDFDTHGFPEKIPVTANGVAAVLHLGAPEEVDMDVSSPMEIKP